jgi:hypothetical protein
MHTGMAQSLLLLAGHAGVHGRLRNANHGQTRTALPVESSGAFIALTEHSYFAKRVLTTKKSHRKLHRSYFMS